MKNRNNFNCHFKGRWLIFGKNSFISFLQLLLLTSWDFLILNSLYLICLLTSPGSIRRISLLTKSKTKYRVPSKKNLVATCINLVFSLFRYILPKIHQKMHILERTHRHPKLKNNWGLLSSTFDVKWPLQIYLPKIGVEQNKKTKILVFSETYWMNWQGWVKNFHWKSTPLETCWSYTMNESPPAYHIRICQIIQIIDV